MRFSRISKDSSQPMGDCNRRGLTSHVGALALVSHHLRGWSQSVSIARIPRNIQLGRIAVNSINQYICVIGSVQGLLLFTLLISDRRMTTASRILGLICLVIALTFSVPFILMNLGNGWMAWTLGPVFFLPVALGPLGYLYCRSALLGTRLGQQDLLHAIPVLLCYGLTADIALADPQRMAEWIAGDRPESIRLQMAEHLPFLIAVGYSAWTGWMIWQYRRKAANNLSNFDPDAFRWLLALQVFSLLVWSLKTLPGPVSSPTLLLDIADILLAVFIYIIAIIQWRNPYFFTVPALASAPSTASSDRDTMPQRGELDPSIRAELFQTLKQRLEEDRLYLDSGLTLERLAAATGLSKHHVSEVLNRHAGKNFYDFINGYRIDFVCNRLRQSSDQSVLDIALEAGFASKSTFNAIFKRYTGHTPTEFRTANSS